MAGLKSALTALVALLAAQQVTSQGYYATNRGGYYIYACE